MDLAISFGPCEFSGVVFDLEVAMTFGPAEPESFAVVANEHDAVARVDGS